MNQQENTRPGSRGTIAFAMCGSFCTFEAAVPQAARLAALGWQVLPVMSFAAAATTFSGSGVWAIREPRSIRNFLSQPSSNVRGA